MPPRIYGCKAPGPLLETIPSQAFRTADLDGNGELDLEETFNSLHAAFPDLLGADVDKMVNWMALFDANNNQMLSPSEAVFLNIKPFWKQTNLPTTEDLERILWCAGGYANVKFALSLANREVADKSNGVCPALTLSSLDTVLVTAHSSWPFSREVSFFFTIRQGVPQMRYLTKAMPVATLGESGEKTIFWQYMVLLQAITRYKKYNQCKPPGMPADVCVCALEHTTLYLDREAALSRSKKR